MEVEETPLNPCSFENTRISICHLTTYNVHKGLKAVKEFSVEKQQNRRSGLCIGEDTQICFQHEALLLQMFEFLHRTCNLFGKNNHTLQKSLRSIDLEMVDQLNSITVGC